MTTTQAEKTGIENVNHPGQVRQVDGQRYAAMKCAYLSVLPTIAPGLTAAEILERVMANLPQTLFPGGSKAGWWAKAVQLDLEAKCLVAREKTTPLRFHKR